MKRAASLWLTIAAMELVHGRAGASQDRLTQPILGMREAGARALESLLTATNEIQLLASWHRVLKQKDGPDAIAQALPRSGFPAWVAMAGLRVIREERFVEPDLVLALARAAGLAEESQNLTDADVHSIASQVSRGDPARGERVYRRREMGCMICHAIGGAGGKVGPDLAQLSRLGTRTNAAHIVESVLNPNKQIREGFHSVLVVTKDDVDLTGVLVRENNEDLVLRDANSREISVSKSNIVSQRIGGSLMPVGVVDILSPPERLDLFRFLLELGRPGPFDVSHTNIARVWRVNSRTSLTEAEILKCDLKGNSWVPILSTVEGALLKEDLEVELASPYRTAPFYAAARFHLPQTTKVRLKLTGPAGSAAWIDARSIVASTNLTAHFLAGSHTFLLRLDPMRLPPEIRLEVSEGTFSTE